MEKHPELNGFDNISVVWGADRSESVTVYAPTAYEVMVHKALYQSPSGKELLDHWRDELATKPLIREGDKHNDIDIGMVNGVANFKRDMLRICNKINTGGKK